MNKQTFLDSFGHIADAPGGIRKLRQLILSLAVRGRLTTPLATDEPAAVHLANVQAERQRRLAAGELRRATDDFLSSDVDALYSLPTGWSWAHLRDTCINLDSKRVPLSGSERARRGGPYDYYGASGVIDTVDDYLFDKPLLLIGEDGANLLLRSTPVAFVARGRYWVNNHAHVLDSVDVACLKYLAVFVNATSLAPYVTGTAQPKLNQTRLNQIPVAVPPLEEQKRIVRRVDELMALCDELEEQQAVRIEARSTLMAATLHRVSKASRPDDLRTAVGAFADNIGLHLVPGEGDLAALKRIRQAILDLAVRGRLTHRDPDDVPATDLLTQIAAERDRLVRAKEIRKPKQFASVEPGEVSFTLPGGWTWARANEFFIASDSGWSPQCLIEQAGPGEWGVLKTSAVSRGAFEEAANKKLPPTLEPRPQLEVQPGEFVMIRASGSKGLVGRGAIVTETESHLMLSDKHIRLSFLAEASTRYWAILNDCTEVQRYYSAKSSGTSTMSNVTRDRIGALAVPVPPLGEQVRIAEAVEALFALCDDLEQQFLAAQDVRRDLGDSVVAHAS
ncbi:hypothetical protein G4X40_05520 [Rhodococcus sp. D2-41]|uniref:restriction endonuclease subunit S n=1 Tax=Speluncibacter jeojiensis TaxID=2710754 RepID=UPI0024102B19|nr:restriction endonuclease subunit S [Rhodococcus sp. D2-41]MDG3009601.1 hypothetical protein [Rhodococcus sp. D2-41]